jgi:hypothetical protein
MLKKALYIYAAIVLSFASVQATEEKPESPKFVTNEDKPNDSENLLATEEEEGNSKETRYFVTAEDQDKEESALAHHGEPKEHEDEKLLACGKCK